MIPASTGDDISQTHHSISILLRNVLCKTVHREKPCDGSPFAMAILFTSWPGGPARK
jgi:hypothetical protein